MMKRGLFVGRFQPPHLGHKEIIEHILTQVDEVVIVIAAAQVSHTIRNPLTGGERLELVRILLENADIDPRKYWLIQIPDIFINALWVNHLKRFIPRVDVIFGNNPFTTMLFEEAGLETKNTPLFKRDLYESRQIREKIKNGESLEGLVDVDINNLLIEWNISDRLKALYSNDSARFEDASSNFR